MLVYLKKQAQIEKKAQVRAFIFDKAFTKIFAEYFNYNNFFSAKNTAELLKHSRMNNYIIK